MLKIATTGVSGRMASRVVAVALGSPGVELVGVATRPGTSLVGCDSATVVDKPPCGILTTDQFESVFEVAEVVIDFSRPSTLMKTLEWAAKHSVAVVSGTTGLTAVEQASMTRHAQDHRLLWAANMSLGVTALLEVVSRLAEALGGRFDTGIIDLHHRNKVDAPSGTALALQQAVSRCGVDSGIDSESSAGVSSSSRRGSVDIVSLRLGDLVGEHSVLFTGQGERLTITHQSIDRDIFAHGAIEAAQWLHRQPPGRLYDMRDVLGLALSKPACE